MKLKIKHKDKWHSVTAIEKSEDSISYKIDKSEDKIDSKKVSDFKFLKGEKVNPDGSISRFPGKEQLLKPLNKSINLLDKWALIKSKLDNKTAFKNMDIYEDEQQQQPEQQPEQQQQSEQQQQPSDEELQQPTEEPENSSSVLPDGSDEDEDTHALEGEDLNSALRELGYSDVEIAHIVHGHAPAVPSEDEQKHEAHKQNLSQDEEGHTRTLDNRDLEHSVDIDHKKKMNELEIEYYKREKEIKLKHLEEELDIKRSKIK